MKKRIAFTLTWKRIAGLLAAGVAAALAVSLSGLVSIAASSGHFAPVGWFLHWTMQNAVARQSLGISVPEDIDLSDPALVQRAAGHFATGCAPCHGAPGIEQSPVVLSMTPHPPRLEGQVGEWADRELFWILKHGIKYSGMPAWPTQERDDEVWAQVAFLRAYPEMSPQTYADLALGGERGSAVSATASGEETAGLDGIAADALTDCARCHGRDGLGRGEGASAGAFPVIAGQSEAYLKATLQAYDLGFRHSGFMQPPASRYPDEVLDALALWYAKQPLPGATTPATSDGTQTAGADPRAEAPLETGPETAKQDGVPPQIFPSANRSEAAFSIAAAAGGLPEGDEVALLALGRTIAEQGIPARKIPACDSCHAEEGRAKNDLYPYLGGQPAWYIDTHLHLWKEGTRSGTRFAHLMDKIAIQMTDEQIEAVSAWYASRPLGQ